MQRIFKGMCASFDTARVAAETDEEYDLMPVDFTEADDDREVLRNLFYSAGGKRASADRVTSDALIATMAGIASYPNTEFNPLVVALEQLLAGRRSAGGEGLSFEDLEEVFALLPRVRGERVRWAESLGLSGALAKLLVRGDAIDGLRGLRELDGVELDKHINEVCAGFAVVLPRLLRRGLRLLRRRAQPSGVANSGLVSTPQELINSKFVMDGAYVGRFATLDDFYRGPEALIGVPNPRILEGAEAEHCRRPNAKVAAPLPPCRVI